MVAHKIIRTQPSVAHELEEDGGCVGCHCAVLQLSEQRDFVEEGKRD